MLRHEWQLFLTAVQYFTRVPVPAWVGHGTEQLNAATRYFAVVGALVGSIAATVYWGSAQLVHPAAAAFLCTIATVLITGAFHEDGLADSADGLYGGWTVSDRLHIMKDSRVGSYGVLALLLVVGMKLVLLAGLPSLWAIVALIAAHAISRGCAVAVMGALRYVREDEQSRAKPIAVAVTASSLAATAGVAMLALAVATYLLGPWSAAIAAGLVAVTLLWMVRLLRRKLGGYTGDGLGATQQLCEVAFYLGAAAAWKLS